MNIQNLNITKYIYFIGGITVCMCIITNVNNMTLKLILISAVFLYTHIKMNACDQAVSETRLKHEQSLFSHLNSPSDSDNSDENNKIVYDRTGRKRFVRNDSVYDHHVNKTKKKRASSNVSKSELDNLNKVSILESPPSPLSSSTSSESINDDNNSTIDNTLSDDENGSEHVPLDQCGLYNTENDTSNEQIKDAPNDSAIKTDE